MSLIKVTKAMQKHLLTLTPSIQSAFEATSFEPETGVPFQYIQLVPRRPENPTLGDDYYRDVGEFQVFLCYPANQGTGDALERAELVRNHFKRGTTLTEGGLEILITGTPQISGTVLSTDRTIIPVIVKYSVEVF